MTTAIVICSLVIVGLFGGMLWLIYEGEQAWQAFVLANGCEKTGTVQGNVVGTFGISTGGSVVYGITTIPSKIIWRCKDGSTHVR